jgi:transposase
MEKEYIKIKITVPVKHYSESFKRMVVCEYERGILNKDQLQIKYGIGGHSRILEWCRKYGKLHYPSKGINIGRPMKDPQKQRIKELEQQLKEEKLKVIAYQKLISIAEQEEGISILKKDVTKQLERLHNPTPEK